MAHVDSQFQANRTVQAKAPLASISTILLQWVTGKDYEAIIFQHQSKRKYTCETATADSLPKLALLVSQTKTG